MPCVTGGGGAGIATPVYVIVISVSAGVLLGSMMSPPGGGGHAFEPSLKPMVARAYVPGIALPWPSVFGGKRNDQRRPGVMPTAGNAGFCTLVNGLPSSATRNSGTVVGVCGFVMSTTCSR